MLAHMSALRAVLLPPPASRRAATAALATASSSRRRRRSDGEGGGGRRRPDAKPPPPTVDAAGSLSPGLAVGAPSGWVTLQEGKHPLRPTDIPIAHRNIMGTLRRAGHSAYLVGGAVRDTLLGLPPKDYDVLTSAPSAAVAALFPRRAKRVGARFPITLVKAGAGTMVEVTSLEAYYEAGAAALAASAAARDFTVNALFYDPLAPAGPLLHDPSGRGLADASARVLRACGGGGPAASFADDPARVLRAARLAARCSLRTTPATTAALLAAVPSVTSLPPSRIQLEVASALAAGSATSTLALWRAWGLLAHLLPPLDAVLDVAGVAPPRTPGPAGARPARRIGHRFASLPGLAALAALDAAASPAAPAPPSVWPFAVAAPIVEARLAAGAVRDPDAALAAVAPALPWCACPALAAVVGAVDDTLRAVADAAPASVSQASRRRAMKGLVDVLDARRARAGRRGRRAARGGGAGDDDPTSARWAGVYDVVDGWVEVAKRGQGGGGYTKTD